MLAVVEVPRIRSAYEGRATAENNQLPDAQAEHSLVTAWWFRALRNLKGRG